MDVRHGDPPLPPAYLIKNIDQQVRNRLSSLRSMGDARYEGGMEACKKGQFPTMVVRRVPWEPTLDELSIYLASLKETPGKHKETINVLKDYRAESMYLISFQGPRVQEILKDNPYLLLGFSVFVPKLIRHVIPPDANRGSGPFQTIQTMVGKRVSPSPVLTLYDAFVYMDSVEEAFHDQPAKYDEFLKIMFSPHRVDGASAIVKRLEELMKGHRNLFLAVRLFFSADPKITIPAKSVAPRNKRRRKRSRY